MQLMSGSPAGPPQGLSKPAWVFVEQLGWQLRTRDARDARDDGADMPQSGYADIVDIVAQDEGSHVFDCIRFRSTTHHCLLEDIFPQLFNGLLPLFSSEHGAKQLFLECSYRLTYYTGCARLTLHLPAATSQSQDFTQKILVANVKEAIGLSADTVSTHVKNRRVSL